MEEKKHPLHDVLVPHLDEWAPLFSRWEDLSRELSELQKQRQAEAMCGDRNRKLARIDRRLAELRAEIWPTQPGRRYLWSEGKVFADAWVEFVTHWRRLQQKAAWSVGPAGAPLADEERAAWELLIKGRSANGIEKID